MNGNPCRKGRSKWELPVKIFVHRPACGGFHSLCGSGPLFCASVPCVFSVLPVAKIPSLVSRWAMARGPALAVLWDSAYVRVCENPAVGGDKWTVVNPGRGDDDLVGRVAVEVARQPGGFNGDLRRHLHKPHAGIG